jgi:hypothetical protein
MVIPIVIRSLVSSIAFIPNEDQLPFHVDPSLLDTLDAGDRTDNCVGMDTLKFSLLFLHYK